MTPPATEKFGDSYKGIKHDGYFRAECAVCGNTVLFPRLAGDGPLSPELIAYCSQECWDIGAGGGS